MSGRISFIGAGPGAADLITVRGARRIAEADVVVWTASLVSPECIQEHASGDAELVDSSRLSREQEAEIYRRAERDKLRVARVHPGDPAMWGEVQGQHDTCTRMDVEVEIVPGVAPFSAAAASIGRELTVPEVAQSLVVTRMEGGKQPMPAGESVREFAGHGTTMALHLSASRAGQLVEELRAGGYADDVPVLVAHKVSWPDETLVRTTVGELEGAVKQHKLWRNALFLVGRAIGGAGPRARSYSSGQSSTYHRNTGARRGYRARREAASRPVDGDDRSEFASDAPGPVPDARVLARPAGGSDSEVAWWAVRRWQDTARGSARSAAARSAAAQRVAVPQQQGLFRTEVGRSAESDVAAQPEAGEDVRASVEPTARPIADAAAESTGESVAEPTADAAAEPTARPTAEAAAEPTADAAVDVEPATTALADADSGRSAPEAPAVDPDAENGTTQDAAGEQPEPAAASAPEGTSSKPAGSESRSGQAKTAPKSRSKSKGKTSGTRSSSTKRKTASSKQDGKAE